MATPTDPNSNPAGTENTPAGNTPAQTPESKPESAPAQPAQSAAPTVDFGEVLTALNALPEKLVHSLREATQPAKAPAQPKSNAGTGTDGNAAQTAAQPAQTAKVTEPNRKTFAQRWFG